MKINDKFKKKASSHTTAPNSLTKKAHTSFPVYFYVNTKSQKTNIILTGLKVNDIFKHLY